MRRGTRLVVEVRPRVPQELARLEQIADDLWYSWNRPARELFARLHPELWEQVSHSPKSFLRQVDEERLVEAARDPEYLERMHRVLDAYDDYLSDTRRARRRGLLGRQWSGRVLLRRVRPARELPDVLRRPGHPRRRPLQGRERPAPAVRRRGPALPPGLLRPEARRRRQPDRRVPRRRTSTTCRSALMQRDGHELRVSAWTFPAACCGCASGKRAPGTCGSTSSTRTSRRTTRPTATSPTASTAATASTASSRRSSSASAARARWPRWASCLRCGTSTRAMRPS